MKSSSLAAVGVVLAAAAIFFCPPPAGLSVNTMHAGGLVALAIGLWAFNVLPEYFTGLIFMLLAVLLAVAPPQVVFSGFASATMWLVFGGLFMAEAVRVTGLGERIARLMLDRYTASYLALLTGVAIVATMLTFLMPATIARVLLLVPLVAAVAARVGFERGGPGYTGLMVCAILTTYHSGTAVLPSNAPNLVLAGAAETLYGVQLIYAEYFMVQAPVILFLKGLVTIAVISMLMPAQVTGVRAAAPLAPMSAAERRLAVILMLCILLWATDFIHHVKAGWIALAAGLACMMPRIGVMPMSAFNDNVRYGPFFYVGAILGLGGVMTEAGLTTAIGDVLIRLLDLSPGADAFNFGALVVMSTLTGLITTNPAQPALLAPIAGHFAEATGWPLKTVLMTAAVGYSTMILPHMVPPAVVGFQLAGIRYRAVLGVAWVIALLSVCVLAPIDYAWWRLIGYFAPPHL